MRTLDVAALIFSGITSSFARSCEEWALCLDWGRRNRNCDAQDRILN